MQRNNRTLHLFKSFLAAAFLTCTTASGAELVYQEGFNTDGTTSGRYTISGRAVYEVPRIQSEIMNFDQKGPRAGPFSHGGQTRREARPQRTCCNFGTP
jgi:hypothetical protein